MCAQQSVLIRNADYVFDEPSIIPCKSSALKFMKPGSLGIPVSPGPYRGESKTRSNIEVRYSSFPQIKLSHFRPPPRNISTVFPDYDEMLEVSAI